MKVYLAGKITGDPCYWSKFRVAAIELRERGQVVLNPAELPKGLDEADYMRICLAMVDSADCVLFLPDWKQSEGAKLERDYCRRIGKKHYFL